MALSTAATPVDSTVDYALLDDYVASGKKPVPFKDMPGNRGLPLIGNAHKVAGEVALNWFDDWFATYGPIARTKMLHQNVVMMLGPQANELILMNRDDQFSSHGGLAFYMEPFFSNSLVLRDFQDHAHHRLIMKAAFRNDPLARYVAAMNPVIDRVLERWLSDDQGQPVPSGNLLFFEQLKKLTLDLATINFLGMEPSPEADELIKAFTDMIEASGAIVRLPIPGLKYHRGLKRRKQLEDYFRSIVEDKRANPGDDLFSQLLSAEDPDGNRFTDQEAIDHIIFTMMAAHDTTTITMTRMVYHLGQNPEWQDRLRSESQAMGKAMLDFDDLPTMQGIDMVMRESLRMCAPVPGLPRRTTRDMVLNGYHVPAGTVVFMEFCHTHYMEPFWDDPWTFDPNRFADGVKGNPIHKYAWVPFGGGVHRCLGLPFAERQITAVMHQLLLKYRWDVDPGYEMRIANPGLPSPSDGFPLAMERI